MGAVHLAALQPKTALPNFRGPRRHFLFSVSKASGYERDLIRCQVSDWGAFSHTGYSPRHPVEEK